MTLNEAVNSGRSNDKPRPVEIWEEKGHILERIHGSILEPGILLYELARLAARLKRLEQASPTRPGFYTTRRYPCGCRAEGPGDVPAYCSEHGAP